jgi:hypothetical protein
VFLQPKRLVVLQDLDEAAKSVESFVGPGVGALKSYFAPEHFLIDQAGCYRHQRSAIGRLRPLRLKRNDLCFALGRPSAGVKRWRSASRATADGVYPD